MTRLFHDPTDDLFTPSSIAVGGVTMSAASAAVPSSPVTRVVTTGADSGAGSLRAILAAAKAGDTIVFAASVSQVTLASAITVTTSVVIDGLSGRGGAGPVALTGSGSLVLSADTSVGNLTVGGNVLLRNNATLTQTGTITVGDASNGKAQITNAPGKIWNVRSGDILAGSSTATLNNAGTINTPDTQFTTISARIVNLSGTGGKIVTAGVGFLWLTSPTGNDLSGQAITCSNFRITGGANLVGQGTLDGVQIGSISGAGLVLQKSISMPGFYLGGANVSLGANTLTTTSIVASLSSIIYGGGKVVTQALYAYDSFLIGGSVLLRVTGVGHQEGNITIGDLSGGAAQMTIAPGAAYELYGDNVGIFAGNAASTLNIAGTLTRSNGLFGDSGGTGVETVSARVVNLSGAQSAISVLTGTLSFKGDVNRFTDMRIDGAGTFTIGGSGTNTIEQGTTIATTAWNVGQPYGSDKVTLVMAQDLQYGGTFGTGGITTIDLGTHTLKFTGESSLGTARIVGAGVLAVRNSSVDGLSILGGTNLRVAGEIDQSYADTTLGDVSGSAAQIFIGSGGAWTLQQDTGIVAGNANVSIDIEGGQLLKTGGGATRSVVAPNIVNPSGHLSSIRANVGKLELAGTVSGQINLYVGADATMLLDKASDADVYAYLQGSGATLQLNDAPEFAGIINGFTGTGRNLDLRSIAYGGSTTFSADGTVLHVTDGTHTANLNFAATLSSSYLHFADDAHGGTLVTYAAPGPA